MPGDLASEWVTRLPGLELLWSITRGRPDVRIAVLDGPLDTSVLQPASAHEPIVRHGTHVHSIISGARDVPGIAAGCEVFSIPVFGESPQAARATCTQQQLAAGIHAALARAANIINISAAQQGDLLSLSLELNEALQEAVARDVLVVAATGNEGCTCDSIPASVPSILAVGAHDVDGAPLLMSNAGIGHRNHGILAPGANIPGACAGGGLCRASGTSYATAIVSGVAGLLMSADAARGRSPSGVRTRQLLLSTATGPDDEENEDASAYLAGRLNVGAAVSRILQGTEGTMTEAMPGESVQPALLEQVTLMGEAVPAGMAAASEAAGIVPAGCGGGGGAGGCTCDAAAKKPQLVYAIGRLGINFISQARRDSIWRTVNGNMEGDLKPISDQALADLFKKQPFQAQSVVWTLSRTEVPMYAIVPNGAYAAETYRWLVEEWSDANVEFASIPGVLAGQATLYDGQTVDVLVPDLRGMYSWETKKYVKALSDERKKAKPSLTAAAIAVEMNRFLGKIYFRNRGVSPEERALNAAATNAFNFSPIIVEIGQEGMTLRDIAIERSPLNRAGSDYYDVLLTFFDPNDRLGRAPLRARFTIDVSDTVPVMIGDPVTWHEY
jgi:hypothetical protein